MPIVGNGMITLGMSNSQAHFNQYYKEYLQTQSLHDKTKLNTVVIHYCHCGNKNNGLMNYYLSLMMMD